MLGLGNGRDGALGAAHEFLGGSSFGCGWFGYFVLADLPAFQETQAVISNEFQDAISWQRKCLLNIARSGRFSSDRTIREYARDIWGVS